MWWFWTKVTIAKSSNTGPYPTLIINSTQAEYCWNTGNNLTVGSVYVSYAVGFTGAGEGTMHFSGRYGIGASSGDTPPMVDFNFPM